MQTCGDIRDSSSGWNRWKAFFGMCIILSSPKPSDHHVDYNPADHHFFLSRSPPHPGLSVFNEAQRWHRYFLSFPQKQKQYQAAAAGWTKHLKKGCFSVPLLSPVALWTVAAHGALLWWVETFLCSAARLEIDPEMISPFISTGAKTEGEKSDIVIFIAWLVY